MQSRLVKIGFCMCLIGYMKFLQKNVLKHLQVADIPDLMVSSTVQEGCKLLQGMGGEFLHHLFPDECFYIEYTDI